jgi:Zn finger protein HypA/HybF involved in hydrogenase expression
MLDRTQGLAAVRVIAKMLDEIREEELVAPCRSCSYPVPKVFRDDRGLLYCSDCDRKQPEVPVIEIKEGEDG